MIVIGLFLTVFLACALIGWFIYESLEKRSKVYLDKSTQEANVQLEDMFVELPMHRLEMIYVLAPLIAGLVAWLVSGKWPVAVAAGAVGFIFPKIWIKRMRSERLKKFQNMLVDSLLLLSSCLRAGLSMLQGFAVVAEEMPPPVNQEIGLLLKEIKMGVTLEDALVHFKKRVPSDETNLLVTAVMVARETGGDVTTIFARLVETMRERKKIKEKITTLTFMAKAQGMLMASLPLLFLFIVYNIDKRHIEFFFNDPVGRMVGVGVVLCQSFVVFLFIKFSKSPL